MSGQEIKPIRWWEVLGGGIAVAGVAFAMIWGFAILAFALGDGS